MYNFKNVNMLAVWFRTLRVILCNTVNYINSNFDVSCAVSEIRRLKGPKSTFSPTPLLFGLKFRGVPLGVDP